MAERARKTKGMPCHERVRAPSGRINAIFAVLKAIRETEVAEDKSVTEEKEMTLGMYHCNVPARSTE